MSHYPYLRVQLERKKRFKTLRSCVLSLLQCVVNQLIFFVSFACPFVSFSFFFYSYLFMVGFGANLFDSVCWFQHLHVCYETKSQFDFRNYYFYLNIFGFIIVIRKLFQLWMTLCSYKCTLARPRKGFTFRLVSNAS